MCVAIPGQVEQILERSEFSVPALVRFPHGTQQVDLVLVPDADAGDHIIAHSGYAVSMAPLRPDAGERSSHPHPHRG